MLLDISIAQGTRGLIRKLISEQSVFILDFEIFSNKNKNTFSLYIALY